MKVRIGRREIEIDEKRLKGDVDGHVDSGQASRKLLGRAGAPPSHATCAVSLETEKGGPSKPVSSPAPSPPYKSTWEARYAQHLELLKQVGEIEDWWYEPMRFLLPGQRNTYKPDFVVKLAQVTLLRHWTTKGLWLHQIEIHEVKGWSKNRREGITKLKTAAGLNTWAAFKLVSWDREQSQWIEHACT